MNTFAVGALLSLAILSSACDGGASIPRPRLRPA